MNNNITKTLCGILLALAVVAFPFFGLGIIFGLAGSNSTHYVLMGVGYFGLVVFSLTKIITGRYFPLVIVSLIVLISGIILDQQFWDDHNAELCAELRAEPSCRETACGFDCDNFNGFGFVTSYEVCEDKSAELCKNYVKDEDKDSSLKGKVLDKFEFIVLQIVNSTTPDRLDFEKERVAIYNCLKEIRADGRDGESDAIARLQSMNLTPVQLNKYYDYMAAHGQNANRQAPRPIAGLPAGDPDVSCEYLSL